MTRSGGFGYQHPREDTELETCVLGGTDRPEMDVESRQIIFFLLNTTKLPAHDCVVLVVVFLNNDKVRQL